MNKLDIKSILKILEKESKNWNAPVVTFMAQKGSTPFEILISTILSLRTKDEVTAVATKRLFKKANTPNSILKLGEKDIEKLIYPVGFYKTKAKNILEISRILIEKYNGVVPNDLDELLKFKGVGRKTANLVLIEAYDLPGICVDTHVHRITNRFGYVKTKNPEETEMTLREKLPKALWKKINPILVAFGQIICRPVSPHCSKCPVSKICPKIGVLKSR